MTRPEPIHIGDLADPHYPEAARELLREAPALAAALAFDVDGMFAQARAETGLDDFGDDPGFRGRVAFLLDCLKREADLSPVGMLNVHGQLMSWLRNRLRLEDLYRRHPEIAQIEIARPIFILGLPRSGTTHLNNLISADPNLRSLPYWEGIEPIPAEEERFVEPDPRIARAAAGIERHNALLPYFRNMHELTIDHVEEEYLLLALEFCTNYIECLGMMPTWRDWYRTTDHTPYYLYLRKALRALQWLRGGERWILKCPQHMEQIGPLFTAFPDAELVLMRRDPAAVLPSVSTIISYIGRYLQQRVDPHRVARYQADRAEDFLRAFMRDEHLIPPDQICRVDFEALMRNEMGTIEKIYAAVGQPFSAETRDALMAYSAAHPRGRHGRLVYDLKDFGLDLPALREQFRFYTDAYGIPPERGSEGKGVG